jgi:hypothetical protein
VIVDLPRNLKMISRGIDKQNQLSIRKRYNIDNLQLVTDSEGNVVHKDPKLFYHSFGLLTHPFTKQKVKDLTDYQYEFWKSILANKYNIAIKSNKIGLSTTCLILLFQNCMLKEGAGNEKLVICQTQQMAKEHLYTLRQLLLGSENFKHTLIMRPGKYLLKDEVTKVTQLFVHNPYNPSKPTRIIGLGASAASSVSWKNVDFIYVSDITKAATDYTEVIDGAFTRLAMSRGKFVIETIPRGPRGKVYSLWQDAVAGKNDFKWFKYPVEIAIKAGLVSQQFIDEERRRLGPFFTEYYGAEFISVGGNVFRADLIQRAIELAKKMPAYDDDYAMSYPKSMGVDPAFGSESMFAICVTQLRNGIIEVIHAEEFQGMDHESMCRMIVNMMHRMNITKVYVDGNMMSVVNKLKELQADQLSEEDRKTHNIPFSDIRLSKYKINAIPFGGPRGYGMQMIQHCQRIFSEGIIAIDELRFKPLIQQFKTATLVNPSGEAPSLDKETYGTMDLFDAFRLSCANYGWETPQ